MTVGCLSVHFVGKQVLLHNSLFPVTVFNLYPVSQPRYLVFCIDGQKKIGGAREMANTTIAAAAAFIVIRT